MKWQHGYMPLLEGLWVEKYNLYQERLRIYDSVWCIVKPGTLKDVATCL